MPREEPGLIVDQVVAEWRKRMEPQSPELKQAAHSDAFHHAQLEIIRRTCHMYDRAMELEGIDAEKRRRILSFVLLGDPSGLEMLESQRIEQMCKQMLEYSTPSVWAPGIKPGWGMP